MIYANNNGIIPMNEGLKDLFKKKSPSIKPLSTNEFDDILNEVYECFREIERNESKLIAGNKMIRRNRSLEENNESKIRRDFNKGKSYITFTMYFEVDSKQGDFDSEVLVKNFHSIASKLGFEDLDDITSFYTTETIVDVLNSYKKYPRITREEIKEKVLKK